MPIGRIEPNRVATLNWSRKLVNGGAIVDLSSGMYRDAIRASALKVRKGNAVYPPNVIQAGRVGKS